MSSRACEAGQSGAGVRLASGHRGRFSGNGCQADPVGCLCLQVLLRLCRTRSDRDCEDGIVVFGWQSGWGGTPSVGLVSVSMSAWGWGRHWEGFPQACGALSKCRDAGPTWPTSGLPGPHWFPAISCSSWRGTQKPRVPSVC